MHPLLAAPRALAAFAAGWALAGWVLALAWGQAPVALALLAQDSTN
jgi:hypothetical protein